MEGVVPPPRRMRTRNTGTPPLVPAAYNGGERGAAVWGGAPPSREPRRYVARILRRVGQRETSPGGTRATGRVPEVRAVIVASPDRITGPAREALERRTFMEIDRRPAAPSGGERQGADEQPSAAASHFDGAGRQGP